MSTAPITNPSYSVNGIIYNSYTRQPAKPIGLEDAAQMAGVTPKTMKKWLKRAITNHQLRYFQTTPSYELLDYEIQHWINAVVKAKKPKKTWKRGIANLKNLLLINRQTTLTALQKCYDQERIDSQKRFNRFDDSHVAAYKRGVNDAIGIVCGMPIENCDYIPQIGQSVWVGGCVGVIASITDDVVTVEGTYFYPVDDDIGVYAERWSFRYSLSTIMKSDVRLWHTQKFPMKELMHDLIWDYEHIKHHERGVLETKEQVDETADRETAG